MNEFLRAAFRPYANRHYSNKRISFTYHIAEYLPVAVVFLLLAIFFEPFFWLATVGIVVLAVITYFIFDKAEDRLMWSLFWKRMYPDNQFKRTDEHDAIKAYEKNPTEANKIALEKHIKKQLQ